MRVAGIPPSPRQSKPRAMGGRGGDADAAASTNAAAASNAGEERRASRLGVAQPGLPPLMLDFEEKITSLDVDVAELATS